MIAESLTRDGLASDFTKCKNLHNPLMLACFALYLCLLPNHK